MTTDDSEGLRKHLAEVSQELAELKRRQKAARREKAFLDGLLGAIPGFVARMDSELRLQYLNRLPKGIEYDQVLGQPAETFIAPEQWPATLATIERSRESGRVEHLEVIGTGAEGRPAHYRAVVTPIADGEGGTGFVLVSFDVSEEVNRQRELERSEAQLRLAVEATGIALYRADYQTGEIEWSERMKQLMGREEPLGGKAYVEQIVHPEDREAATASQLRLQRGDANPWLKHRIVRPDGTVRWVIPTGMVTRDDRGQPLHSIGGFLDVTETHALEGRLQQAARLEALGTLTGGVAHNLNNLLAVLRPTLDVLGDHVGDDGKPLLAEALDTTGRAAKVVRQLMKFARRREQSELRQVSLAMLVKDAVESCRPTLPDNVQLDLSKLADPVMAYCDPSELSEVVMNLIFNARDSLTSGGTANACIRVELVADAEAPSSTGVPSRHPYALLTVSDNGPGMTEAVRERIFDPFFTTKGPRGLGLGLAMSWRAVSALGGVMLCESEPGQGARFQIYLPQNEAAEPQPDSMRADLEPTTHLSVLLVDDDASVRRATRRALSRGHHQVVEASTGAEALSRAHAELDAILLDHFLPDIPGTELVGRLREIALHAKIVIFSGEDLDEEQTPGVDAIWTKPLRAPDLLSKLSQLVAPTVTQFRPNE